MRAASPNVDGSPRADAPHAARPRQTFPKSHHLRKPAEFKAVYDAKIRAADHALLVFARPNGLSHSRIGLSVSKKNGHAPRRALIRRLLREAYRLQRADLPTGLDLVLIPRPSDTPNLKTFQRSLRKLTAKLTRRMGGAFAGGDSPGRE